MAKRFIKITGADPLLFRDGRPFTADAGGLTARSLPLPLPTTLSAFVRSQIGNALGWQWDEHDTCIRAHSICVHAPLLQRATIQPSGKVCNTQILVPAPKDALLSQKGKEDPVIIRPLLPAADLNGGGCDLPDNLQPLLVNGKLPVPPPQKNNMDTEDKSEPGKPPKGYNFWTKEAMTEWLLGNIPTTLAKVGGLPEEERIGIEIDREAGKAKESQLYAVHLRTFGERTKSEKDITHHQYSLLAKVDVPSDMEANFKITPYGTLGGERRLTTLEAVTDCTENWFRCPQDLKDQLATAKRVRMVLVTPAIFEHGWKPDWIEKSGSGECHLPAGLAKVQLKLVAVASDRRIPVSGWSVRRDEPRKIRWMVPAGAVYFFTVEEGNPAALYEDAWLKPVSDDEQDRRDGLGLALWGIWR
jgi:CRISPR-associated protein Cmr3